MLSVTQLTSAGTVSFLQPIAGAIITVCTSLGVGTPCNTPLSGLCLNATDVVCNRPNPFNADSSGNYGFWALPGRYVVSITQSGALGRNIVYDLVNASGLVNTSSNNIFTGNNSGSGTWTFTGLLQCKNFEQVRCVDNANSAGWAGTDGGQWIASAMADLTIAVSGGTGGIVDARGLTGAQTITAFTVTKAITLMMGPGIFTFTTNPAITVTSDRFNLIGAGKGTTTIVPANLVGGCILDNHSAAGGRTSYHDFSCDGTGLTNPDYGIKFDTAGNQQGYACNNARFIGFTKASAAALNIARANTGTFINCDYENSTAGISFTGGPGISNLNTFIGGQVSGNVTNILSTGGDGNTFLGLNIATGTASPSVWIKTGFACLFEGNWFEVNTTGVGSSSIRLGDSAGATSTNGCDIRSNFNFDSTNWFVQIQQGTGNKIQSNSDAGGTTIFVRTENLASETAVLFNRRTGTLLSEGSGFVDTLQIGANTNMTGCPAGYCFGAALSGQGANPLLISATSSSTPIINFRDQTGVLKSQVLNGGAFSWIEAPAPSGISNQDTTFGDSTTHTPSWNNNNNGTSSPTGAWQCTNVTPVTVNANVTTDQNLMACTVPAGTLNRVGRTLRLWLAGVYSTPAASTTAVVVKAKLGALTLATWTSTALAGIQATNDQFNVTGWSTTQTGGATAAFEVHGNMDIDLGVGNTVADSNFADVNTATVSSVDSTAVQTLQITIAFTVASASNSATQRQLILETVN